MTEEELDAIEAEDAAICGAQPVKLYPSDTKAQRAARKRKSRAAKAAS